MNFNSQICTTVEQSQRLLSLGLKKETADCCYLWRWESDSHFLYANSWKDIHSSKSDIPAWSLHRLMWLVFNSGATHVELFDDEDAYEVLIYNIEWRIKKGYFNKEYLV